MVDRVSIRPGVSILSVLRHLNYKPWFAMAEFVDNSLQSFIDYRDELAAVDGNNHKLKVAVELDHDGSQVTIRDNAAGIHEQDYARAFRPAEIPPDRSGLAEFGMGMKSASCWFAPKWVVRTSGLGEPIERTVSFDIETIVRDDLQELDVRSISAPANAHYTEIVLSDLYMPLRGRTIGKIKDHLGSIYRIFEREGAAPGWESGSVLELRFDWELLSYEDPAVLVAPYFKDLSGESQRWSKDIDLDYGMGHRVHGFAALRERGSTAEAGFALFRRNRLIQGSREEGYRPPTIFGSSNSFTYQRLFGELHLEGFEVSHTKDGFQWQEHEELVLEGLKAELDKQPTPLLSQAEGHRSRVRSDEVRSGAEVAVQRTGDVIESEAPRVIQAQLAEEPVSADPERELPETPTASRRLIDLQLETARWQIELELSTDPGVGEWVSIYDQPSAPSGAGSVRRVGIRVALAHPFMERFGGTEPGQIEPLLRVAAAIVLSEITAREAGVRMAGTLRRNINQLLRDALSKP
jgi:hypothetical protein